MNLRMQGINRAGAALALVGLSACAITQDVRPVSSLGEQRQICVVQNVNVRKGFEESLLNSLRSQGYET